MTNIIRYLSVEKLIIIVRARAQSQVAKSPLNQMPAIQTGIVETAFVKITLN